METAKTAGKREFLVEALRKVQRARRSELGIQAGGIEPAKKSDASDAQLSNCVDQDQARAAPALHFGRPNWLDRASIDADLLSVVLAWKILSEPIRKAILALVHSAVPRERDEN